MAAGLALLVVGVLLLASGALLTTRRVRRAWGTVDETSMRFSQGNGTVPSWVSLMVLSGWVIVAVGVILTVIALF